MDVFLYMRTPVLHLCGVDLLELRPIQVFFDLVEPYSLVLLIAGHVLFIVICRNALLRSLIDNLTGDVLGPKAKSLLSRGLETLLPGRVFAKTVVIYRSYYLFLLKYRP
jgi:hypothetical protein